MPDAPPPLRGDREPSTEEIAREQGLQSPIPRATRLLILAGTLVLLALILRSCA